MPYEVYLLPTLSENELSGSWDHLPQRASRRLGRVPTESVVFDPSRRKFIDGGALRHLLAVSPGT